MVSLNLISYFWLKRIHVRKLNINIYLLINSKIISLKSFICFLLPDVSAFPFLGRDNILNIDLIAICGVNLRDRAADYTFYEMSQI